MRRTVSAGLSVLVLLTTCATVRGASDDFGGTTWRLAELQSSDDTISLVRPDDPSKYEMRPSADRRAALSLDCNRATGRWEAGAANRIMFTTLVMTRAMCPPGALDTRISRELGCVRNYILEGDQLRLVLMADGGSQLWTRSGG